MDDPIHDAAPQAAGMQVKRIREAAPQRRLEIALNTVLISQEIHQSENASYSPKFPTIIPSSSSGVRIFAAFGLAFSSRWFSGASAPLSAIWLGASVARGRNMSQRVSGAFPKNGHLL